MYVKNMHEKYGVQSSKLFFSGGEEGVLLTVIL